MVARGLSLSLTLVMLAGVVAGRVGCAPSERKMRGLVIDAATERQQDYRSDPDTVPLTAIAHNMAIPFAFTPCASFSQEAKEKPELEMTPKYWGYTIFPEINRNRFLDLLEQIYLLSGLEPLAIFSGRSSSDLSLIRNDNITGLNMTREGDSIAGTVYFEESDYHGAVDFVARKGPAGWRVDEFRLPVMGLHLNRINDTSWRARKPFRADGWLPTHRNIDRENPVTLRISNGESLRTEVDGKKEFVYSQTMEQYLTGRTVLVLADEDVTVGQVFEVLDRLSSPAVPCALFYLASESRQSAETILIDSASILMTSGAPFRRGQIGNAAAGWVCLTESSVHVSSGDELGSPVDHIEDIFPYITSNVNNNLPRQFLLAADPNVPASRIATALDKLAGANAQRVVLTVGSVYRGVLFELMGRNAEE